MFLLMPFGVGEGRGGEKGKAKQLGVGKCVSVVVWGLLDEKKNTDVVKSCELEKEKGGLFFQGFLHKSGQVCCAEG